MSWTLSLYTGINLPRDYSHVYDNSYILTHHADIFPEVHKLLSAVRATKFPGYYLDEQVAAPSGVSIYTANYAIADEGLGRKWYYFLDPAENMDGKTWRIRGRLDLFTTFRGYAFETGARVLQSSRRTAWNSASRVPFNQSPALPLVSRVETRLISTSEWYCIVWASVGPNVTGAGPNDRNVFIIKTTSATQRNNVLHDFSTGALFYERQDLSVKIAAPLGAWFVPVQFIPSGVDFANRDIYSDPAQATPHTYYCARLAYDDGAKVQEYTTTPVTPTYTGAPRVLKFPQRLISIANPVNYAGMIKFKAIFSPFGGFAASVSVSGNMVDITEEFATVTYGNVTAEYLQNRALQDGLAAVANGLALSGSIASGNVAGVLASTSGLSSSLGTLARGVSPAYNISGRTMVEALISSGIVVAELQTEASGQEAAEISRHGLTCAAYTSGTLPVDTEHAWTYDKIDGHITFPDNPTASWPTIPAAWREEMERAFLAGVTRWTGPLYSYA